MSRYVNPVGAPAFSTIGQAISGAIDRTSMGWLQNEERKRQLREQGIVPESEIGRQDVVIQDRTREAPVVVVDNPIRRAVQPVAMPVAEDEPAIGLAPGLEPPRQKALQMAGPVVRESRPTEASVSLGDGMAYVPGRDREAVIGGFRARQAAQIQNEARQEQMRALLPAAERVRSGKGTGADMMLLAAAGVKPDDLLDPKSKLNQRIEEEREIASAREEGRAPWLEKRTEREGAEWDRRQGVSLENDRALIGARAASERGLIDYRAERAEQDGTGPRKTVNYKTDRRTAPVYGRALYHAQAGFRRLQGGREIGRRPATLEEVVSLVRKNPISEGLSDDEVLAIASQAYREAAGQRPKDTAGSGNPLGGIDLKAITERARSR